MKKDEDHIEELIGKVLAGEATQEEMSAVAAWAAESDENRRQLNQLTLLYEKAGAPAIHENFDADAAWLRVKTRLKQKGGKSATLPTRYPMIRMAATVAIFLSAGLLAYKYFNPRIETFALATQLDKATDTLPDGSRTFLNSRSSIDYEFNPRKKIRKVKLSGEGYFEVKHENERPFQIEAGRLIIEDLGTAFNVKAYPESDSVEVIVSEGEVKLYTLTDEKGLHVKAGESGIYLKQQQTFFLVERIDSNALAYKTGVLNFNNADLKTVISRINEVYHSRISLKNPLIGQCRITVAFKDEKLETIVEILAETLHLTVTREKNRIILDGVPCE